MRHMRTRWRGWTSRPLGQGLVEFALVLPVFLIILFGLIDMGRYVFLNSVLSQAAREAARVGAVEASWVGSGDAACGATGGPVCPASVNALRTDMTSGANRMMTPFASIPVANLYTSCDATSGPAGAWTTKTCATRATGSVVSVRVQVSFTPITPIIGQIVGTLHTSASASMIVN